MRNRALLVPLLALTLLAVGCGRLTDAGDAGGIEHPTGPNELVLRMDIGGGFVPVGYALAQIPQWSLFGDGRLITEGPQIEIYPGPALPSLQVQTLTEDGVQAILEAAREAGLIGPDRTYDYPCVADAPTTTFTLYAGEAKHVVSAYALGIGEGACQGADTEARATLAAFQAKLTDLASWLPAGSVGDQLPFEFDEMRVFVQPYSASPEPGLEQNPVDWPLEPLSAFGRPDPRFSDFRCGVVSGADFANVLPDAQRANQLTPWRSDGERYGLIFRPLLPDEHTC